MCVKIIRGDDVDLTTTFKDADWVAIDITWYTVFFTVKKKRDLNITDATDTNAIIQKDVITHTDPTAWKTTISLLNIDTAQDVWVYTADLQLKDAGWKISSVQQFDFEILPEVTQRS